MAYRTEINKSVKESLENLVNFLTSPVSMEVDRSLAQGNGNIKNINFNYDNAQTEDWEVKYDANNDVFKITGSVSGSQDDAQIGVAYDNGIISFTIEQGSNAWQDGDIVVIKAYKGSNPPFKVIGNGWYTTTNNNKAWVNGTYGFSNSYKYINSKGIKKDKNDFTLICSIESKYYDWYSYVDTYGYRNVSYIYCSSITSTSHKIEGDVSIVVNVPLKTSTDTRRTINECRIENLTSAAYSGETTKYIEFNLNSNKILFMEEEVLDFTDYINQNEDKFLQSVVFTIDSANGYLSIYIDGQKVLDNLQNDKWKDVNALWGKRINYAVLDGFYTYDRKLTEDEITQISNNNGHPPHNLRDFFISIVNNTDWQPYVVLQSNKYGFLFIEGTNIRWYPTAPSVFSNKFTYATPSSSSNRFNRYDTNVYKNKPYGHYQPKLFWGNYTDVNDTIQRYWFVSDGSSLAIVIKKFDSSKVDNPTYQIMYIGWGIGDTAYDYPFILGWGGDDEYDVNDDNFRFGYMYNDNTSFWDGDGWRNNYVDDGALNREWQNIKMNENQFSIIQVNKYKNLSNRQSVVNFGAPKWLSVINVANIPAETEVYINSEKYIVIPDNHIKAPYNYLVKMDKE